MKILLSLLLLVLGATFVSAAEPVPTPKPIFFAKGASSGTVGGRVLRGVRDLYSLKATAGQTLTINMTAPDDNAVFQIYEPGTSIARDADGLLEFHGKALHGAGDGEDATRWNGRLPRSGTYIVVVGSTRGSARYSFDVTIE